MLENVPINQNPSPIRSLEEARNWFVEEGVPVCEWARSQGFKPAQVYAVLSGRARGRWGVSHRVAVALRIKIGRCNAHLGCGDIIASKEPGGNLS